MDKFLVLGEALTDCVIRGGVTTETPGGSPMNVAIGLGRLENDVTMATRFGGDERGTALRDHLAASSVATIAQAGDAERTSSAQATIAEDGSADYVFDLRWDLTTEMIPAHGFTHVHAGSIGATLEPGGSAVEETLRRASESGATVSYDPNARPIIMGDPGDVLPRIEALIGLSTIVKASDEDCEWLYPGVPFAEVAGRWRDLGAALVIITQGPDGVEAWFGDAHVVLPIVTTTVVDTIGAGDSFMAGLLHALASQGRLGTGEGRALEGLTKATLIDALQFALGCAAITVSRVGANPPRITELSGS
jgi:fructokinase